MKTATQQAAFIAGDWGTSHLRLYLCDAAGQVLQQRDGPGIASLQAARNQSGFDWQAQLSNLLAVWPPDLPVWLCGMIGSNIGWINVPYVNCPTDVDQLAQHAHSPVSNIFIAAGLSATNCNDALDVMRGEETQIVGALRLQPSLRQGKQLLCLPGTHTKWVLLEFGKVMQFTTATAGELFAALKQHSILVPQEAGTEHNALVFLQAVRQAQRHPALLQLIFECRSRQISGQLSAADAGDYLSGLLIGTDVLSAVQAYGSLPITIIGAPILTQRYAAACRQLNSDCQPLDGAQAALAGLTHYYSHHHRQPS